jgi:hypothetical protein
MGNYFPLHTNFICIIIASKKLGGLTLSIIKNYENTFVYSW